MNRTILDRVIGYLSPATELKRAQARARIDATITEATRRREYAGATIGRRAGDWVRGAKDGTEEARLAAKRLRESARSLVRDNAYAALALEEWEANLAPIAANAMVDEPDPDQARKINQAIDTVWYEWTMRADWNGLTGFDGLQFLVARALRQDGGCLVRRRPAPRSTMMAVPIQLQVIELDYLDDTRDIARNDSGSYTVGGIQFDSEGRREGYWVFPEHPGGAVKIRTQATGASIFVPASEMLHIYEPQRPGQQLGVSSYAPVILRSHDIDGYEDAELARKQTEACMVGFIEDSNPDAVEGQTIGQSVTDAEGRLIETFSPGMLAYLPMGRRVQFNQPASAGGYADYMRTQLRGMAAGLGLPYELATGDLSQVSFISGRLGLLSFRRRVRKLQSKVIIPQFLEPVWAWFIAAAQATDAIGYRGRTWAKWTPPRWESIQPLDDANADLIDIRSGVRTLAQVITERGGDPDDQLREIAATNDQLDELGIILDCDPRQRTKTGAAAVAGPAAPPPEATPPPAVDGSSDPAARIVNLR